MIDRQGGKRSPDNEEEYPQKDETKDGCALTICHESQDAQGDYEWSLDNDQGERESAPVVAAADGEVADPAVQTVGHARRRPGRKGEGEAGEEDESACRGRTSEYLACDLPDKSGAIDVQHG